MQAYLAEAVGTMLLVLLGDGVVANVLLARSKGEEFGLDRHHDRVGRGRRDGRLRGRTNQRRAPQSRRDDRAGDDRQLSVGQGRPATSRRR